MKYTVVWTTTAENTLAEIWLQASDRQMVSDAANDLESELRRDPLRASRPIRSGFREASLQPLIMLINVSEDDRLVAVIGVWRTPSEG